MHSLEAMWTTLLHQHSLVPIGSSYLILWHTPEWDSSVTIDDAETQQWVVQNLLDAGAVVIHPERLLTLYAVAHGLTDTSVYAAYLIAEAKRWRITDSVRHTGADSLTIIAEGAGQPLLRFLGEIRTPRLTIHPTTVLVRWLPYGWMGNRSACVSE